MKRYNIAFIGDGGVGKTAAIKALKSVWYGTMPYVATMGTEVHPMSVTVGGEKVIVNIWDVSGKHLAEPEGLWKNQEIDATCVFFSTTNKVSLEHALDTWPQFAEGHCYTVGTKIDSPNTKPQLAEFVQHRTGENPYLISATDPAGIERMLVQIVDRLMKV